MRNTEQVRPLIAFILVSFLTNNLRLFKLIKTKVLVSTAFFLFVVSTSLFANQNYSNVDPALPALVTEGEVMRGSQQWYRAHSKQDSFTSNFSADGRLLALTSHNSPVELWDTIKRKPISTFSGGGLTQLESFVDISPNGKLIAINIGERIEIRNIRSKSLLFFVPAISGGAATFSPDGHWFATAIDGKRLDLWDIRKKKRVHSLNSHTKRISALGFSPNGKYLVSADTSGMFTVWNTISKEMLYQFSEHKFAVTSIQFSTRDNTFVSVDTAGVVKLWDAKAKSLLHTFIMPETIHNNKSAAAFSPDGKTVVISLNKQDGKSYILMFDALTGGKPLFVHESNNNVIDNIAFRPDGKSLVVSLSSKSIKVFNLPSRQYIDTFGGQILKANKARVSPDGKLIATGTVDGYIQLWDVNKKTLKYSLKGRNRSIENVSFSPDGQFIISGDNHGAVTVWSRKANNLVFSINAHKSGSAIASMSADNQFLATASSQSSVIKVWDILSNKPMYKLRGHHGFITDLAYSPDGKMIASSSKDGTIKLWDTSNKSLDQTFIGNGDTVSFSSLAFSHDGRYLAGGTDQGTADKHVIEIWSLHDKKHSRTLNMHDSAITAIRFSTNNKQLVSGSMDGVIKVWNIANGLPSHTFVTSNKKKNTIKSVDFSKDGKNILSVAHDGATHLWDLKKKRKAYRLLGGPRGTWVSENLIKQRFVRGDDGSLNVKSRNTDSPPAPLAPKGVASEDKLILTASRERVKVSKNGGKFRITIKNIGKAPSFWLQARQLDSNTSSVTLLSNKLTRLDAGRRGILNLEIIPHNLAKLNAKKKLNLKMEVISKAGSHFPIVIPLEFQGATANRNAKATRKK